MMDCDEPAGHQLNRDPVTIILSKEQDQWLNATKELKKLVIGSNKRKASAIMSGVVPRLRDWMLEEGVPLELRTQAVILLGSLAFGSEKDIQVLVDDGIVPVLLRGLFNPSPVYVEACLRCLRTIFMASKPPVDLMHQDGSVIPHLLDIIDRSVWTKETIANILANSCTTWEHQISLLSNGAIQAMAPLLGTNTLYKIQMPVLKFFAALCHENTHACMAVLKDSVDGVRVLEMIRKLMSRDKTSEMQMAAAKCLAYLFRGQEEKTEQNYMVLIGEKVVLETMHTLVRMCKKDRTLDENVEGAETLAYLIALDQKLQATASICDHCIKALAQYLSYTECHQIDTRNAKKKDVNWSNLLKTSAFQAFGSIGANDESIRDKIIAIDSLPKAMMEGMASTDPRVQEAACCCLLSLSRSVQQLRTALRDSQVWEPLIKLMSSEDEKVVSAASAAVCNMLLDFSPCREALLNSGALNRLVELAHMEDKPELRLNGVWGMMNLAFNADHKVKQQIVEVVSPDLLYGVLSESNVDIVVRALGLLRNLFTKPSHIDQMMGMFGDNALQAVCYILSQPQHSGDVKERTLCILANIADGLISKGTILDNANVMEHLKNMLVSTTEEKLLLTAILVVKNLLSGEDEGVVNRRTCLRTQGIQSMLQELTKLDKRPRLQEKARSALRYFQQPIQQ